MPPSELKTNKSGSGRELTPMMRQYMAIKRDNPDTLLLYRMGDFYELFFDDAKTASEILGLTLTKRNHGGTEQTPLAGFPHHALDRYANRLVHAGHRIAICEQTEDPKKAKGVVKRDVIEVITAGTATEDNFIREKSNNYIVSIFFEKQDGAIALCDLSTGEFSFEELSFSEMIEEISRSDPSEILMPDDMSVDIDKIKNVLSEKVFFSEYPSWKFSADQAEQGLLEHFGVSSLDGLGLEGCDRGISAAGALLSYLKEQKKNDLKHITGISRRSASESAGLDPSSIRNLELLTPLHSDETGGTLVSVLDRTGTAMGSRMLKRWITHPLKDPARINQRLDAVSWFRKDLFIRSETELFLKQTADIERLIGKISLQRANARDIIALKNSLKHFPSIIKTLFDTPCAIIKSRLKDLENFEELAKHIESIIVEEPPLSLKEGGYIKKGVSSELDEIKSVASGGKEWIAGLQKKEREKTGISSLKIGYNKVFGYYIEVSKPNIDMVPENFIRKQTLVNAERYITPDLKEMESKVLGAQERLTEIEYELFASLRNDVAKECGRIQKAAESIAVLDVLVSLGRCAAEYDYSRPEISGDKEILIRDGRHPVIERMNLGEQFIPNDTEAGGENGQILLITGPNMAGKSTYLRQNALIVIMAQIGSFVPASHSKIGVVDKIFTRVGASDRLARGQSTFLVEMIEVANILNNATDRSLVILDEVGRGTSTFDGISIAWAVSEYLHETKDRRAITLFATHYHELTELTTQFEGIKNLHVNVKEWNDQIIFLRKISDGSCDHSYGIQVARLAGVPEKIIKRAKEILSNLEDMEFTPEHKPVLARRHDPGEAPPPEAVKEEGVQMNFLDSYAIEIIQKLKNIDTNTLTPLDALNTLAELVEKSRER